MPISQLEQLRQQFNNQFETTGRPQIPENIDCYRSDIAKELAHAMDVEQWLRQLEPNPSLELVLAARFHDWERIIYPGSTGGYVGDRKSPAYLEYKKAHAARSASLVLEALSASGLPEQSVCRVVELVAHHDDTGEEVKALEDSELQTLVSADSLSFFSLIAVDMVSRHVSEDQIRAKMRFMIGKMDATAREMLYEWHSPYGVLDQWKNEELLK